MVFSAIKAGMKKNSGYITFTFLYLLLPSRVIGQASDCGADRARFVTRNDTSLRKDRGDEYKKHFDLIAGALQQLAAQVTVRKLNAGAKASEISTYLGCMVNDASDQTHQVLGELTNAPAVLMSQTTPPTQAIVATYPLLGYTTDQIVAIAPSRPIVQCFARNGDQWSLIGELGEDYALSTFFIYPLISPVPGETWSLLAGTHIGDTGSRLLLEVAVCDGKTFSKKWTRGEITGGKVEVSGSAVLLAWEKIFDEHHGRIFDSDPLVYTEILHVTTKGLE